MNRKIMKMASVVLALILALGVCGGAVAADSKVNFTMQGPNVLFVFTPENTDLFQNFKDLMPGDTVEQKITVQNTAPYIVRLWLAADPAVSEADRDFLSQMKLTVKAEGSKIFEAAASEQDGLAPTEDSPYGVLLGTFKNRGTVELTAKLELPVTMGNEYMAQEGIVPWTFTAEEVVIPDTPDTGDDYVMWIWVAVGGVLLISLLWLVLGRKKQKEA